MCHRYTSLSLYQEEPSRSPMLATINAAGYDDMLGGGTLDILHKVNVLDGLRSREIRAA
jgi:hypothetical protein